MLNASILLMLAPVILGATFIQDLQIVDRNPCSGVPHGIFAANPKGCEFFFYCHHGEAMEGYCPHGLLFNSDAGICDLPEHVHCNIDNGNNSIEDNDDAEKDDENIQCPQSDSKHLTFLSSKIDCGRYYICYHGQAVMQQCISDLHWNAAEKKCDFPTNANCKIKPQLPACPAKGQMFYPHPYECDYFIFCINGFLTIQQCPFYHHWDIMSQTCKWQNVARCATSKSSLKE